MIMSNLKSLAEKVGMGFSPRNSKTKTRLGLHHFVAATTDQMLMTRGGYGGNQNPGGYHTINCVHGIDRTLCGQSPCRDIDWTKYKRSNGSSYFSLSDAIKAGWDAATSPGVLGWATALGWVKRTPLGFVGAFSAGYYNNLWKQYQIYIAKVKAAASGNN